MFVFRLVLCKLQLAARCEGWGGPQTTSRLRCLRVTGAMRWRWQSRIGGFCPWHFNSRWGMSGADNAHSTVVTDNDI